MLAVSNALNEWYVWLGIAAAGVTVLGVPLGIGFFAYRRWGKPLAQVIRETKDQVTPNGGETQSLGDTVKRVETKVDRAAELALAATSEIDKHLAFHQGFQLGVAASSSGKAGD